MRVCKSQGTTRVSKAALVNLESPRHERIGRWMYRLSKVDLADVACKAQGAEDPQETSYSNREIDTRQLASVLEDGTG